MGQLGGQCTEIVEDGALGVPPSAMCTWATAMVTPIPASMPWTTAGDTASALRATRRQPRPSWANPAMTVIAQVVRQP